MRVHTVGGELFATAISSAATDYRYAHRQTGELATMESYELPADLAARCTSLAGSFGLDLAGIDLRLTRDGDAFEVNPSPVYSYYESQTGQPIAAAIERYLAGATSAASATSSTAWALVTVA